MPDPRVASERLTCWTKQEDEAVDGDGEVLRGVEEEGKRQRLRARHRVQGQGQHGGGLDDADKAGADWQAHAETHEREHEPGGRQRQIEMRAACSAVHTAPAQHEPDAHRGARRSGTVAPGAARPPGPRSSCRARRAAGARATPAGEEQPRIAVAQPPGREGDRSQGTRMAARSTARKIDGRPAQLGRDRQREQEPGQRSARPRRPSRTRSTTRVATAVQKRGPVPRGDVDPHDLARRGAAAGCCAM